MAHIRIIPFKNTGVQLKISDVRLNDSLVPLWGSTFEEKVGSCQ